MDSRGDSGVWGHGGDIWAAAGRFARSPDEFVDFSVSVNPLGPPPGLSEFLRARFHLAYRYPEPDARELAHELAAVHGVPPESVVVGNGASELLMVLVAALAPKTALTVEPTYSDYRRSLAAHGVVPTHTCIAEMKFPPSGPDVVFLCNPNNPTGDLIPEEKLPVLPGETTLVVDESFMEFVSEGRYSLAQRASRGELVVVRSLTKIFAIPGLRLGYVVCGPALAKRVRELKPLWSVNGLASAAGLYGLGRGDYIEETRSFVRTESRRLGEALRVPTHFHTYWSAANFVLVKLHRGSASEINRFLGERGMLVRDCSNFIGLDSSYIRIGLRSREENDRLLEALRQWQEA